MIASTPPSFPQARPRPRPSRPNVEAGWALLCLSLPLSVCRAQVDPDVRLSSSFAHRPSSVVGCCISLHLSHSSCHIIWRPMGMCCFRRLALSGRRSVARCARRLAFSGPSRLTLTRAADASRRQKQVSHLKSRRGESRLAPAPAPPSELESQLSGGPLESTTRRGHF